MVMAFDLSCRLGYCARTDADLVRHHIAARGLPVDLRGLADPAWTAAAMMGHVVRDKKVRAGRVTFVLVGGIGQAFATRDVPEDAVRELFADYIAAAVADRAT